MYFTTERNLHNFFEASGCSLYRMSRFEEYDFYADKKDFLQSRHILTFTDLNGKLMALRPDVTLSIIKHATPQDKLKKFYYDEKVYRVPKNSSSFREISQIGVEFIGDLNFQALCDVIELAARSLHKISNGRKIVLDICNLDVIESSLTNVDVKTRTEILDCIAAKNIHELKNLHAPQNIVDLLEGKYVDEVCSDIVKALDKYKHEINVDYSVAQNLNYYNGIVFRGFIEGIPHSILSGGQYDKLMNLMGHKDKGVGFALYLDLLEEGSND